MTATELEQAIEWMEARWPDTTKKWLRWEDIYTDFASFTAGALREALNTVYRGGARYAPTPPELRRLISETAAARALRGEDPPDRSCNGGHRYARPWPTDETHHLVCVNCGEVGPANTCHHVYGPTGRCHYCPKTRP